MFVIHDEILTVVNIVDNFASVGSYEGPATGYKHVYFNINGNTLAIWCSTVVGVIIVYDVVKHLLQLYCRQRLRSSMALLVVASIYPHYYTWWSLFNAVNDDYYEQFLHQVSLYVQCG
jgi:hypothetical protein